MATHIAALETRFFLPFFTQYSNELFTTLEVKPQFQNRYCGGWIMGFVVLYPPKEETQKKRRVVLDSVVYLAYI